MFLFTVIIALLCVTNSFRTCNAETLEEYMSRRQALVDSEFSVRTGSNITLSEDEMMVNKILMGMKSDIYESAMNTSDFIAAKHFFTVREEIRNSSLFKMIHLMPKGGLLHGHDYSLVDLNWLITYGTYKPNLFICTTSDPIKFKFQNSADMDPSCDWQNLTEFRQMNGAHIVDNWIHNNMSMVVDNPREVYPTQNDMWTKFQNYFRIANGLAFSAPLFDEYVYETLREFYKDNVQYIEFRGGLLPIYELNGTVHDATYTLESYYKVVQKFKQDNPGFIGAKFIYTVCRTSTKDEVLEALKTAIDWNEKYPDFLIGFDLVCHEDPGFTQKYYLEELLYLSTQESNLRFFFHAGETDWSYTKVDANVLDAILLNASRIGHGFAIAKHPVLLEKARESNIAIEINPISNQVLGLVDDLRNHPGAMLLAKGYPIVISADDPPVWGARGLSYDFYMAFVAFGRDNVDLATLKQLAINSIEHSAMTTEERNMPWNCWTLNKAFNETV